MSRRDVDRSLAVPGLGDLWTQTKGDPQIVIALLDGPVDQTHVSFTGASLTVIEIAAPVTPRPGGDATAHGTLAASLIFGQHGVESPVAGIAPDCRGMIVPIYSDFAGTMGPNPRFGRGAGAACTQLDLARAMLIAAENGARIINVSGGQHAPKGAAHLVLADAVGRCARRGILIVAAAGNDGCEFLHVPAALPGVLAVAAMDAQGQPLQASNWGGRYRTEGLLAPGAGLLGARSGGGMTRVNGTSFATAVAAGAAGLLWSLALRRGWPIDGMILRAILLDSAEKCPDDILSCKRSLAGRLDLRKAGALISHLASGEGGGNDEILLDRRENRLDDLALRLARRTGVQALSRPARCAVPGDAWMGDEICSSSTSAEFPLTRTDGAAQEVMSSSSTPLAESATASLSPPALTQSSGCGCASC